MMFWKSTMPTFKSSTQTERQAFLKKSPHPNSIAVVSGCQSNYWYHDSYAMAIHTFDSMDTMLDTWSVEYFDCSSDVHSTDNHNNHHNAVRYSCCNFCWYSFGLHCLCFAVCLLNFCCSLNWWCVLYWPMVRLCTVVKTEELLVFCFVFVFVVFHGKNKGNVRVCVRAGACVCLKIIYGKCYFANSIILKPVFKCTEHTTSIIQTNTQLLPHKHTVFNASLH